MPNTRHRARLGGSAFTVFAWNSGNGIEPIAFARQISHTSPTPVGPGPTPIHPMDEPYAVEILTPAASNIGSLTLELYELYNKKVWERLSALANTLDLVNIFIKVASLDNPITMYKYIIPPHVGTTGTPYVESYHNCVITNVLDGESIEIGTMEVMKQIEVAYTRMSRDGVPNLALELRDSNGVPNSGNATR